MENKENAEAINGIFNQQFSDKPWNFLWGSEKTEIFIVQILLRFCFAQEKVNQQITKICNLHSGSPEDVCKVTLAHAHTDNNQEDLNCRWEGCFTDYSQI